MVEADFARQLERELADALVDAERYRWLRDTNRLYLGPPIGRAGRDKQVRYIISATGLGHCDAQIDTLDAAIDAARKP